MLAGLVLLTAATGCNKGSSAKENTPTAVTGEASGHEVKANLDCRGGFMGHSGHTYLMFLNHEIEIDVEKILLDGQEVAQIPADVKLEINVAKTALSITADGKSVLSTTITR